MEFLLQFNYNTQMEQYIYIFTIILEIIVALQIGLKISEFNKKVIQINSEIVLLGKVVKIGMHDFRKLIVKFNKVAAVIVRVKKFNIKRILLIGVDIVNIVLLFKTFKTFRGLSKFQFLKKLFSYSLVKGFFKLALDNLTK